MVTMTNFITTAYSDEISILQPCDITTYYLRNSSKRQTTCGWSICTCTGGARASTTASQLESIRHRREKAEVPLQSCLGSTKAAAETTHGFHIESGLTDGYQMGDGWISD